MRTRLRSEIVIPVDVVQRKPHGLAESGLFSSHFSMHAYPQFAHDACIICMAIAKDWQKEKKID